MKKDLLFMLNLISSVVLDNTLPALNHKANWKLIYQIAERNSITNIIAVAILSGNYKVPSEICALFKKRLYEHMVISEKQNNEMAKILKAFSENQIKHMPIKGIVLQDLYPTKDLRTMKDSDILIKTEDFDKISHIMTEMGYTFQCDSDHEYIFYKPPFVYVELHKFLIPSYNDDMYKYFGDGWKKALKKENNEFCYHLNTEDNFIYTFSHLAKHYRDSGCGIKPFIDIWLLIKKYPHMDFKYIEKQFKSLNILTFYKNVLNLLESWFNYKEFDPISTEITGFVLNNFTFGTTLNHTISTDIRKNKDINPKNIGKFKHLYHAFPRLSHMKKTYPILDKIPLLLPLFWIVRLVNAVLFKRKNIADYKKQMNAVSERNVNEYYNHMKNVGLDIYNGRGNS